MQNAISWLVSIEKRLLRVETTIDGWRLLLRAAAIVAQYLLASIIVWLAASGKMTPQDAGALLSKLLH